MTFDVKVNEYHPALQFSNGSATLTDEFWRWAIHQNMDFNDFSITTPMKHFESSEFKPDFMVVVFKFKKRHTALCFALASHWKQYRVWA